MNRIRSTVVTAAVGGGSILGLVGVAGIADAAAEQTAQATVDDTDTDVATDTDRAERREARREARQANRQELADLLGLSVVDLATELRDGATLADVATANGVEVDAVVDLIVEQQTARLDLAVENGRLTAEEAEAKIVELDERVQTRVEEGRPERDGRRGMRGHRGRPASVDADDAIESAADNGADDGADDAADDGEG